MKLRCQITGIPFTTSDMLPFTVTTLKHPIFALPFDELQRALIWVKEEEERVMERIADMVFKPNNDANLESPTLSFDVISQLAREALNGKEFKHPAFRFYQTRKLILLAWMDHAKILRYNPNQQYYARIAPEVLETVFWQGVKACVWICTIRSDALRAAIPLYNVSKENVSMSNLGHYFQEVDIVRGEMGTMFQRWSDQEKIDRYETATALLAQRRGAEGIAVHKGNNSVAAHWALLITSAPKHIYNFWHSILATETSKLRIMGAYDPADETYVPVALGDIIKLRDWLSERLLSDISDDSYYFAAKEVVTAIMARHELIFSGDRASYSLAATTGGVQPTALNADNLLNDLAKINNLQEIPKFIDFSVKLQFVIAMAKWRSATKLALAELEAAGTLKTTPEPDKDTGNGTQFQIV